MWHTNFARDLENHIDLNAKYHGINLTKAIIGILTYNILFIPAISLMIVGTLHLDGEYAIPIAIAWGVVGIYLIERFACRNIQ